MPFVTHKQIFEDLVNVFKALMQFGLNFSTHKCQLFRDYLTYMGCTIILKDGKSSYTLVK